MNSNANVTANTKSGTDARTKRITTVGMLCAIAFLMVLFFRIPVVLFLSYEPKDVMITIGGFMFGPWTAMVISVIVSFIEMARTLRHSLGKRHGLVLSVWLSFHGFPLPSRLS